MAWRQEGRVVWIWNGWPRLQAFAQERDWEQFHTPKNLAMALSAETGELLELFQWLTAEESRGSPTRPPGG